MNKIKAPALVGQCRNWSGCTSPNRAFAPFAPPYGQAFLAAQPLRLLAVDRQPLAPQKDVQSAIAEPAALMRQFAQPLPQCAVVIPSRAVANDRPICPDNLTRPPLANSKQGLKMCDRFTLCNGRYHFFDSRSFRPALSSIASARSRLSFPFSSSSARNRLASDTSSPPYLDFQL